MPFEPFEPSPAEPSNGSNRASSEDSSPLSGADYLRSLRSTAPEASAATSAVAATTAVDSSKNPAERRRYPRYKCEGSAQIRTDGSSVRTWATFSEVSLGGCYLEMMTTYPVDTKLDLKLQLLGFEVHTWATVRINYPFLGMGIAFTDMVPEEHQKLEAMIQALIGPSNGNALAPTPPGAPQPDSGSSSNAAGDAVLNTLRRYFENHEILTRDEFRSIVAEPPAR
jgi:hypothetical protein